MYLRIIKIFNFIVLAGAVVGTGITYYIALSDHNDRYILICGICALFMLHMMHTLRLSYLEEKVNKSVARNETADSKKTFAKENPALHYLMTGAVSFIVAVSVLFLGRGIDSIQGNKVFLEDETTSPETVFLPDSNPVINRKLSVFNRTWLQFAVVNRNSKTLKGCVLNFKLPEGVQFVSGNDWVEIKRSVIVIQVNETAQDVNSILPPIQLQFLSSKNYELTYSMSADGISIGDRKLRVNVTK